VVSQFEFFMIIVSVLIAIAISELVGWWGRLIRSRQKIAVDPLHLSWTIALLIMSVTYWIGIWPYAEYEIVHVGQIWALILPTVCLILVAYAITPDVGQDENNTTYIVDRRRSIFSTLVVFVTLAIVADWVFIGFVPSSALQMVFLVVLYMACVFFAQRWVQVIALSATLLYFIGLPVVLGLGGLFENYQN
jgi:hypothetical protein